MRILDVFSINVKSFRKKNGFTQEMFAEKSELHRTYISDVERGTRSISLNNVQKIANALGVKPFQLFIESKSVTK